MSEEVCVPLAARLAWRVDLLYVTASRDRTSAFGPLGLGKLFIFVSTMTSIASTSARLFAKQATRPFNARLCAYYPLRSLSSSSSRRASSLLRTSLISYSLRRTTPVFNSGSRKPSVDPPYLSAQLANVRAFHVHSNRDDT